MNAAEHSVSIPRSAAHIQVPATSANLGPGFDCLGLALALYNEIEMREIDRGLEFDIQGEGAAELPQDKTNYIVSAAQCIFDRVGYAPRGLFIRSVNGIPMSSGLGSSSAAIVGGLVAANLLTGSQLSRDQVLALAVEIEGHPDNVVPAILGGLVIAAVETEGPIINQINLPPLSVIAVTPDLRISTEEARRILPTMVPRADAIFNLSRTALVIQALARGDFDLLSRVMNDRLHQPYRKHLITGYDDVIEAARSAGAAAVAISGSGPTLVAFAPDQHSEIAQAMQQAFKYNGVDSRAWILNVDRAGARAIDSH